MGIHVQIDQHADEDVKAAAWVLVQNAFAQALASAEPGAAKARVLLNLGVAYERNGQMFRATECYQETTALAPSSPRAQKLLGSALLHLGRTDEAQTALRAAAAAAYRTPELRADALSDLGNVLVRCCVAGVAGASGCARALARSDHCVLHSPHVALHVTTS